MFIGALTDNDRALSVGQKTYGKGLVQRFFPLTDGSALLLTHAELTSPLGMVFNGHGFEPDIPLPIDMVGLDFSQEANLSRMLDFIRTRH